MANPEVKKLKARTQAYLEEHPEFRFGAPTMISNKRKNLRTGRKLTGNERCFYCGKKLTRYTATLDHVIPLSRGGTNGSYNLVWCCKKCNFDKGSKLVSEWMEEKK